MEALDVPLSRAAPLDAQLLNYLRERHVLLILDNFEHLLEGTTLIREMLAQASGLRLLVTSRERLSLRGEWLFPLRGMAVPEEEAIAKAGEEGDIIEQAVAILEGYSAVELFVQCAQQVRPGLTLASAGVASVAHICQLVEGMPLAIELAAPWVRVMPCEEIAREIERNLEFLATSLRDMPQRHRSMQAVFDHSWQMLSTAERSVLRNLSVFRGGFRRAAAEAVAVRLSQSSASLAVLSSLVDKSWLRTTPSGRYEIHELVRQYCASKLDAEPAEGGQSEGEQARDRHSSYYGSFVQEREGHLHGRGQAEAFAEILADMDNVRAGWSWALQRVHVETMGKYVEALAFVGEWHGWHQEALRALEEAAVILRQSLDLAACDGELSGRGSVTLLLGDILCKQAKLCHILEQVEQGITLCEESLALLQHVEPGTRRDNARIDAKAWLGRLLYMGGDSVRARQLYQEAIALAEEVGDAWHRESALFFPSMQLRDEGRYSEAEALFQRAIAIADEVGEQWLKAVCLGNLSIVLRLKGEYHRAEVAAQESLRIRQEIGDRMLSGQSLVQLGDIATARGDYDLARQHYEGALTIGEGITWLYTEVLTLLGRGKIALALGQHAEALRLFEASLALTGDLLWHVEQLIGLGHATYALGEVQQAREWFFRALEVAMETEVWAVPSALVGLAGILASEAQSERAAELLALALHHPATTQETRDRAQGLLSELASELPQEVLAAATAQGQARGLQEVAAEMLAELGPRPSADRPEKQQPENLAEP
jgi:predicted ATPase